MPDIAVPVSVVITTYNQSHFLARAIESVNANTVKPLEIAVVDDGSSDRSNEDVCGRYREVRLFRQTNQGVSAARNTGAATARSEWIVFLDADDWLLPTALSELTHAAMQSPEAAFVIGRSERRSSDTSVEPTRSPPIGRTGDPYRDLLAPNTLWHPAQVLFNSRLLRESGGWKLEGGAEDLELVLRLATRHPYQSVPGVVSIYWQHSMNVSGDPWRMYQSIATCFHVHLNDPRFNTSSRAAFFSARASRLDFYGRGILLSGLSEMRKGNDPRKLVRGLAFVAVRRPPVLAWFVRFLFLRMIGRYSSPARPR